MNEKSLCANRRCNWRGTDKEVLRAPNPFEPGEEMFACPKCKDYESLVTPCDIEGCWNESTAGVNTSDGYRRLCGMHYRDKLK